jgi:hypothetical protein
MSKLQPKGFALDIPTSVRAKLEQNSRFLPHNGLEVRSYRSSGVRRACREGTSAAMASAANSFFLTLYRQRRRQIQDSVIAGSFDVSLFENC